MTVLVLPAATTWARIVATDISYVARLQCNEIREIALDERLQRPAARVGGVHEKRQLRKRVVGGQKSAGDIAVGWPDRVRDVSVFRPSDRLVERIGGW